jgi:hypothetical protein
MTDEERYAKIDRYFESLAKDRKDHNYCTNCRHLQAEHRDRHGHCSQIEYEQGCFGPTGHGIRCHCWRYSSPHPAPLDEYVNLIEQ